MDTRDSISVWKFDGAGQIILLNDQFEDLSKSSLDQITSNLPTGAYTTFRTFDHNYAFHLQEHIKRLVISCSLVHYKIPFSETIIRFALRDAIQQLYPRDYRVRILIPTQISQNEGYIIAETLIPYPQKYYLEGIRVVTVNIMRKTPRAKISNIIQETATLKQKLLSEYQEIILMDENGYLIEGVSSNFFAVFNHHIYTAGSGILEGITRRIILEVIVKSQLPLRLVPLNISSISSIQEAFISSSSRGLFPVVGINETTIGRGMPGEVTRQLSKQYIEKLHSEILPI